METSPSLSGVSASSGSELLWWRWVILLVVPSYWLFIRWSVGTLRIEHIVLSLVFVGAAWGGTRLRKLSFYCLPFFITAAVYEGFHLVQHLRGTIHVADLYYAELRWFGITAESGRQTLADYFLTRTHVVLDLLCGFAYLAYLYEIVIVAVVLYFRDRSQMSQLAWGFFVVNTIGLITYLLYPAAPPWYVQKYGLGPAILSAAPDPAGTLAFDQLLGINYFANFYKRSANVFGAMPSLHVAYPVLVFCVTARRGLAWALSTALFALLVAFSAVYLRHHYVWDILVGGAYGIAAWAMVLGAQSLSQRTRRGLEQQALAVEPQSS